MTPDSHCRKALRRWLLLGVALLVAAAPAFAQTTYTYQGNNYDVFSVPGPTFNASMGVSGSFTMTLVLPPNLAYQSIGPPQMIAYSFSNGSKTFTFADSEICRFEVATGPSGQISQWLIQLRETAGINVGDDQHTVSTFRQVGASDQGDIVVAQADLCADASGPGVLELARVVDNPGDWTSDALPAAPTMPGWGLLLLLALLALAGAMTLRSRQQA